MKKLFSFAIALFVTFGASAQTIIYSNNFNSGVGAASIVGNGAIEAVSTAGFGSVFHNAAGGQGLRSNYLLLTDTVFGKLQKSGSKELSIAFWVNKGTAINNFYSYFFCIWCSSSWWSKYLADDGSSVTFVSPGKLWGMDRFS